MPTILHECLQKREELNDGILLLRNKTSIDTLVHIATG